MHRKKQEEIFTLNIDYSKIDYKISREKAVKNTDYKTRDIKRLTNTDFSNRNCNQMNTLDSINKRSQSNKKPIIQYDLKGNFIKEWDNMKEAKRVTGAKNIFEVASGYKNQVYKYLI